MSKPIIFADMDGCIASQSKIWRHQKDGTLTVSKAISDHDSWCIDHFKKHAHIVIISGDKRINEAWAKRRGVLFVFTAAAGFHQEKWNLLVQYFIDNFYDRLGVELDEEQMAHDHVVGKYYYLGDAMPDYKCLINAKKAFIPYDASKFLVEKLQDSDCWFKRLSVNSGYGTFEEMAHWLVHEGVLPSV